MVTVSPRNQALAILIEKGSAGDIRMERFILAMAKETMIEYRSRCLFLLFVLCVHTALIVPADAQSTFDGGPDSKRGSFIKLIDHLDDKRGFCIDIPGHLKGVNLSAALVVHTCKDGFWNYDERFDTTLFMATGQLKMPEFNLCLAADQAAPDSALRLMACDQTPARQVWMLAASQLRLTSSPDLCLTVADTPSEVSRGTRNHPVRHLVRPIRLSTCSPELTKLQNWAFTPPSASPGVRFPDGQVRSQ